jgi:hypothetical protein
LDGRDKHKETDRNIEVRGEKYGRKRVGVSWESETI